jgi:hypothetical protein
MASTPLYKFLKSNGTSFYAFPGAAEDISAAYQNSNYKMYFSKFVLLNFPKQNLTSGTMSNKIVLDFDNSFQKSVNATPPPTFNEQLVESLRNYVANQEVVIRESRLNNTKYYYDTNALETPSEKVFFKWAKKLKLIDFEPAIPEDEYFSNLAEFQRNNINDDAYFPEYLWRERQVIAWDAISFYESGVAGYGNKLEIEFAGTTNFKVGDKVNIFNVSNSSIYNNNGYNTQLLNSQYDTGVNTDVLYITPAGATQGQKIVMNIDSTLSQQYETTGQVQLVYDRFVQYIGEITGISNVQEANRNYTEVQAQIPDHAGATPDILFRTNYDVNYKPNLTFPILPSQYQPEILGAELFTSPIVNTPQNYPGSYFAQFDTPDFTYETATGDSLRRSGDYFGVSGDINNPVVNGSTIDGVGVDFNTSHYVKMNIYNKVLTNFDQFNALEVNNTPPSDFEYNAILWYYTVQKTDLTGVVTTKTNLYGISFLDNPDNNPVDEEIGIRFPVYKKMVSNGQQDGTAYAYSLNLNFNIVNENPQQAYNPEAINSLFSMNLFNQAMSRLSSTNDSFMNVIANQGYLEDEINSIKQLLYTQTDITTINAKISNLENLLRLYSSNQIVSTDSISVVTNPGTPVSISLFNRETSYTSINNINTTDLYNTSGIIPLNLTVPENKNFLLNIINNDAVALTLPNNDRLTIVLDTDLAYKQSVDIMISGSQIASQNKKLDIYINTTVPSSTSTTSLATTEALLIGNIDLPVYYNTVSSLPNSAYLWSEFNFDIDFSQTIQYTLGNILEVPLAGNNLILNNSIKPGDTFKLDNFFVGTASVFNFSGQYKVDSVVGITSSYIRLNVDSNPDLVAYGASASLPLYIHGTSSTLLSNTPYLSLNKGKKIKITRINSSDVSIADKYQIDIQDIK